MTESNNQFRSYESKFSLFFWLIWIRSFGIGCWIRWFGNFKLTLAPLWSDKGLKLVALGIRSLLVASYGYFQELWTHNTKKINNGCGALRWKIKPNYQKYGAESQISSSSSWLGQSFYRPQIIFLSCTKIFSTTKNTIVWKTKTNIDLNKCRFTKLLWPDIKHFGQGIVCTSWSKL